MYYRWHCWPQTSLKKFVGDDLFLLLDVIQGRIQDFWKGGGGGGGGSNNYIHGRGVSRPVTARGSEGALQAPPAPPPFFFTFVLMLITSKRNIRIDFNMRGYRKL